MSDRYRALIYGPGGDHLDPLSQVARLIVYEVRPFGSPVRYLNEKGEWVEVAEAAAKPADAGITLPPEAIEAIAVAIQKYQGHASHADTEAKVLREWLTVERARVDEVLRK